MALLYSQSSDKRMMEATQEIEKQQQLQLQLQQQQQEGDAEKKKKKKKRAVSMDEASLWKQQQQSNNTSRSRSSSKSRDDNSILLHCRGFHSKGRKLNLIPSNEEGEEEEQVEEVEEGDDDFDGGKNWKKMVANRNRIRHLSIDLRGDGDDDDYDDDDDDDEVTQDSSMEILSSSAVAIRVPFKWEEEPGKPKQQHCIVSADKREENEDDETYKRRRKPTFIKLQLPPRLQHHKIINPLFHVDAKNHHPHHHHHHHHHHHQHHHHHHHHHHQQQQQQQQQKQQQCEDEDSIVSSPTSILEAGPPSVASSADPSEFLSQTIATATGSGSRSRSEDNLVDRSSSDDVDDNHHDHGYPIPSPWDGPIIPCTGSPYRNLGPDDSNCCSSNNRFSSSSSSSSSNSKNKNKNFIGTFAAKIWQGIIPISKKKQDYYPHHTVWEPTLAAYYQHEYTQLLLSESPHKMQQQQSIDENQIPHFEEDKKSPNPSPPPAQDHKQWAVRKLMETYNAVRSMVIPRRCCRSRRRSSSLQLKTLKKRSYYRPLMCRLEDNSLP